MMNNNFSGALGFLGNQRPQLNNEFAQSGGFQGQPQDQVQPHNTGINGGAQYHDMRMRRRHQGPYNDFPNIFGNPWGGQMPQVQNDRQLEPIEQPQMNQPQMNQQYPGIFGRVQY